MHIVGNARTGLGKASTMMPMHERLCACFMRRAMAMEMASATALHVVLQKQIASINEVVEII